MKKEIEKLRENRGKEREREREWGRDRDTLYLVSEIF